MLIAVCDQCRTPIEGRTKRARFCCDDCRYLFNRRKNGAVSRSEAQQKNAAIRRQRTITRDCEACGAVITTHGNAGRRRYCDDGCKQRAYRERAKSEGVAHG